MPRRLDAFLARAGLGSRSEVGKLIRAGRVSVDSVVCKRAKQPIDGQRVEFDGAPVEAVPDTVTLLLHKPVGYATSRDPAEAPLFVELLPAALAHLPLQPAGRLDRDTSGMLVLTTDGALIQRLTHPKRAHPKRYRVTYRGTLPPDAVERFAAGMALPDDPKPTLPAQLLPGDAAAAAEGGGAGGEATAILHEGRYHQVRRMFAVLGCEVVALHRDRIGGLQLPEVMAAGDCRPLTDDELSRLLSGQPAATDDGSGAGA